MRQELTVKQVSVLVEIQSRCFCRQCVAILVGTLRQPGPCLCSKFGRKHRGTSGPPCQLGWLLREEAVHQGAAKARNRTETVTQHGVPGKASKNLIARARRRLGGCTGQARSRRERQALNRRTPHAASASIISASYTPSTPAPAPQHSSRKNKDKIARKMWPAQSEFALR